MRASILFSILATFTLLALQAAGRPPEEKRPADLADDPLPKGAKARFGVTRPILRTSPGVGLIPGTYTNFLAPTIDGGAKRYDLGTGRPLDKAGIVGPGRVIVSADGRRAAVARPGAIAIVEVATGKRLLDVEPPEGIILVGVAGFSLSADGKLLAYGGRGKEGRGAVVVWDVDKNEQAALIDTVHAAPVFPLLSRDGTRLVTHGPPPPAPVLRAPGTLPPAPPPPPPAEAVRTAQVWDVPAGKELFRARVTGAGGHCVCAALSADASVVAVSAADGPVDLWDMKTGKRLHTLLGRKGQGVLVAVSPDGRTVASVGPDFRIQRWTSEGKPLGVTDPPPGTLVSAITGLSFADNERVICWKTTFQFAVAWEAPSGKLLSPIMDHAAALQSIALPAKEKVAFTSGRDGRVYRWGLTGHLSEAIHLRPPLLPGRPLVMPIVNLSADATRATRLASPAEVYELPGGHDLFTVPPSSAPPAPVYSNLTPDGMKLITVSRQGAGKRTGTCVIWDLAVQKRLVELDVPPTAAPGAPWAGLSPDGTRVVSASVVSELLSVSVVLNGFDAKTGKKLGEVKDGETGGIVTLAILDEKTVVAASSSGRVWTVDYVEGKLQRDIDPPLPRAEAVPPAVAISPDGKRLAVGVVLRSFSSYGVRVYDLTSRKTLHTFAGHLGPVTALRFSADGKALASGAEDTSAILWDLSKLP